ncbi:DNA-binding protein [Clostridium botulinum B str. Osaka05]|uniref:DNA-binding protein n=1 Tax=Clostridium botulinum B str. Osaka05 TaxID=1407017 RepID=A0A060N5J6_CLOBO|nr:hypothetical protein [Clostridium botulinum]BAO04825.1 DNA-binding protein [Clostridium botulinum B str. Osaka05]
MYIFMGTWRTSRGGLGAGIEVFDKEKLVNKIKSSEQKGWLHQLRYAKVNEGYSELLSLMSLSEFEEVFDPSIFTPKEITTYFRKEISEKYGEHAIRKTLKRIPKKELKIGGLYKADTDEEYFYLGKCKGSYYQPEIKSYHSYFSTEKNQEFEGYVYEKKTNYKEQNDITSLLVNIHKKRDKTSCSLVYKPYCIKSVKKFVEDLNYQIKIPKTFEFTDDDGRILKIEFLDVK